MIQSWYNKNVTSLTTQGCNNIAISWLYRTCWNNLATSPIIATRLLQVVNGLFQTCWQLGTQRVCVWDLIRISIWHILSADGWRQRTSDKKLFAVQTFYCRNRRMDIQNAFLHETYAIFTSTITWCSSSSRPGFHCCDEY